MENSYSHSIIQLLEKELFEKKFISKPIDAGLLSKVDVIGFDIDHTLCIYNTEAMIQLLYTSHARFLVEYKKYPKDLLIYSTDIDDNERRSNLKFNEDFVHKYSGTEVVLDFINGNAISLDDNKTVIKAFHGTDELTEEELQIAYGKSKEFTEFNFENRGANYQVIMGHFEYHVIPLFLICVHLYDTGHMKHVETVTSYKNLYEHIFEALVYNYNLYDSETNTIKSIRTTGFFFPEFVSNPDKYLYDYSPKEMLKHLRSKGLALFFATNSFYEFADFIMKHTLGNDYLDYFDLAIYYSKKPSFFFESSNAEAYLPDMSIEDNKVRPGISAEHLQDSSVFNQICKTKGLIEGSYKIVEEFFKIFKQKDELKFIYVGDSIYSDCLHPNKLDNWESIAVCDHISAGFIGSKPTDFKKVWEIEKGLEISVELKQNVFFTKFLREQTLFSISNVDTFKYLIN